MPFIGATVTVGPYYLCEGVEPMGRGRAKAKQTKVARELKYSSPTTDLDALQRELSGSKGASNSDHSEVDDVLDDEYGEYSDDDYDEWSSERRR